MTLYIINYYAIAYVIFPNNITEYEDSYKTYFYARKNWFFSFLGFSFLLDVIDTLLKGRQYFSHSGWEYDTRIILSFILCLFGMKINNRTFQSALVIFFIIYEIIYISRTASYIGINSLSGVNNHQNRTKFDSIAYIYDILTLLYNNIDKKAINLINKNAFL